MKTLPIIDLCRYDKQNTMLHASLRQEVKKINKVLFIDTPEQKQLPLELISEKESEKISEKLKQLHKEFFGQ